MSLTLNELRKKFGSKLCTWLACTGLRWSKNRCWVRMLPMFWWWANTISLSVMLLIMQETSFGSVRCVFRWSRYAWVGQGSARNTFYQTPRSYLHNICCLRHFCHWLKKHKVLQICICWRDQVSVLPLGHTTNKHYCCCFYSTNCSWNIVPNLYFLFSTYRKVSPLNDVGWRDFNLRKGKNNNCDCFNR